MTPEILLKVLKDCRQKIKPKLFIPQFHAGQTPNCKKIFEIAKRRKIFLIEDLVMLLVENIKIKSYRFL